MLKKMIINLLKAKDIAPKFLENNNINIEQLSSIDKHSEIGDYTYIGKNCNITKSEIGRYCSIANNVSIGQGEHHLDKISTSSLFYKSSYEQLTEKDCTIGNDVWIGTDSVILRGVNIKDGVVIGANSVVTKDVPPFAVAVGSPARVIKYRFKKEIIDQVMLSKWWDNDIDKARSIIHFLEKQFDLEYKKG